MEKGVLKLWNPNVSLSFSLEQSGKEKYRRLKTELQSETWILKN